MSPVVSQAFFDSPVARERRRVGRPVPLRRVGTGEVLSETTEIGPPITIHAGGPHGGLRDAHGEGSPRTT